MDWVTIAVLIREVGWPIAKEIIDGARKKAAPTDDEWESLKARVKAFEELVPKRPQ